ncbi:hypothetical protein LTS10_007822 [Elasticomyces elasticus]|nr:hypothetical protein LTS10_007822 [Elasticomyces elasticus]
MDEETRPTKRRKYNFIETLRVLVGDTKQVFIVHKDLAITRSPFIKAAAAPRWSSTPVKKITLCTDSPAIFSDYLQCLYMDTVATEGKSDEDMIDVYVLAEKLRDYTSANTIMDCYIQWYANDNVIPVMKSVDHAFHHTAAKSKLRQLLVDYWVHESTSEAFQLAVAQAAEHGYIEVCAALLQEFGKVVGERPQSKVAVAFNQEISSRTKCHYHQHDEGYPPCASS